MSARNRESGLATQATRDSGSPTAGNAEADPRKIEAERIFQQGLALHRAKRYGEAVDRYCLALDLNPDPAHYYNNMGAALRGAEMFDAAEASYRKALALAPDHPGACTNLGNVCRHSGRYEEARFWHEKALELDPEMREARYNLGLTLHDMGFPDLAVPHYDRVLAANPDRADVRWDRALAFLLMGKLEEGFEQYEWRWVRPELTPRPFKEPFWDGSSMEGKTLLLYAEQGMGDTLNFIRYAPLAAEASRARVVIEVQPGLKRLCSGLPGVARVVGKGEPLPAFDARLPLLSLPRVMKTGLDTIPSQCPYLDPPEGAGFPLRVPVGIRLKVGIVWAGKPTQKNDRNRSVEFRDFLTLASVPSTALYSLQVGPRAADALEQGCSALVRDLSPGLGDFADTAAVVKQLDLVISVDTAVAHLAGALGVPVWTLIPPNRDWRWMLDREDTPWYPSMRLYRARRPREWGEVFARIREDLAEQAESQSERPE